VRIDGGTPYVVALGRHLQGRRAFLRPIGPQDYRALYDMAACGANNSRWRLRGSTPEPDQFVSMLWGGVSLQFGICAASDGRLVGLCSLYGEDASAGLARFAVLMSEEVQGDAWPIEGVTRFLDYAFLARSLRKIYVEVPEYNLEVFGLGLARYFELEATLSDYVAFAGRTWSQSFYSCTFDDWRLRSPTFARLGEMG